MNRTQNYQLCLWDAEDKVQRVDFNADNQKIDAAIKTQANAIAAEKAERVSAVADLEARSIMHTIASVTSETSSSAMRVVVEDLDWSKYWMVVVNARLNMANSTICRIATTGPMNTQIGIGADWVQFVLFPMHDPTQKVAGIMIDNSPKAFCAGGNYSMVDGFQFYNVDSQVLPGSTVTVYGIG